MTLSWPPWIPRPGKTTQLHFKVPNIFLHVKLKQWSGSLVITSENSSWTDRWIGQKHECLYLIGQRHNKAVLLPAPQFIQLLPLYALCSVCTSIFLATCLLTLPVWSISIAYNLRVFLVKAFKIFLCIPNANY